MKKINCPNVAKNLFILLIVSLVFAIYFQSNAYALTSDNINFQGKIVRNDTGFEGLNVVPGSPACVVDGAGNDTCDFQVAYYTASTAGTLLLTETFTNVEIGQYDGVFELSLGSGSMTTTGQCRDGTCNTPVEVISEYKDVYLELKFSPDGTNLTETFTRMPLEATAYSIFSKYAEGANDAFKLSTSVTSQSLASPVTGMIYYNTTTSQLTVYDGDSWEGVKSSLWTDVGTFTYLTSTTNDLVLGASTVSDSTFFFDMDGSSGSYLEIDDASNTNRLLTILSGGNVGIGTATPGAKLEVAGSSSTITNASGDLTISTGGLNGNILLSPHGTGSVRVNSPLAIRETGTTPTYYTTFQGGDQSADVTYTLPTSSVAGILRNTGGVLSWDTNTYLTGVNWSQITNGTGIYMDYKPNNTACTAGQVLKYTVGTGWTCADSESGADNWGSQVVITNSTLTGDGTSGTPLGLALNNANTWTGLQTFRGVLIDTATSTDDRISINITTGGTTRFDGTLTSADLTAARTWILPNATGTLALTSDITVTSVTGTTNQITASPTTGAVVLSLPSDLRAPGTFNATTSIATGATVGTVRIDASGNLTNIGTIASTYITTAANYVNLAASTEFRLNGTTVITSDRIAQNLAGLSSSGTITFSGLTANRLVSTTTGGQLTTSISSANMALSISNETGTAGLAVFSVNPTLTGVTVNHATATYDKMELTIAALGATSYTGTLTNSDLTAARTWTLPNKSGTIAMTSDIPVSDNYKHWVLQANGATGSDITSISAVSFNGSGIVTTSRSGNTITITGTEADTLQSVTNRGASTTVSSSFTGGATIRGLTVDNATATHDRILITAASIGTTRYNGTLTNADLTAARTWTLPNNSGTIALTSDIPAGHNPVTLSGENYLSLNVQQITANKINLTSNVTGTLPIGSGGTNSTTYTSNQFLWYNGTSIVASGYNQSSFASSSHSHNWSQITNGSGIYMNYRPNNTACGSNQVLKYDTTNSRWICADDNAGTGDNWGSQVVKTNSTLTGNGTSGSPLGIALSNANTWTGAQTFSGNTYFPGSGIWDSSGNVGIGTRSPGYKLDVNGTLRVTGTPYLTGLTETTGTFPTLRFDTTTGRVYWQASSLKYKTDITPMAEEEYLKILNATPVEFINKETGAPSIGFIAEDFDSLGLNKLVWYVDGKPESIAYDMITVYTVGVLKNQEVRFNNIEEKIAKIDIAQQDSIRFNIETNELEYSIDGIVWYKLADKQSLLLISSKVDSLETRISSLENLYNSNTRTNISNPGWYRISQLNGTDDYAKFKINNSSIGSSQNLILSVDTVNEKENINIVSNFVSGEYDISKARINTVNGVKYLEIYLETVNENKINVSIEGNITNWISTSIEYVENPTLVNKEFAFSGVLFGVSDMLKVEETGLKVGGDLIANTTIGNIGDITNRWNDIYAKGAIRLGSGSGQEGAIRFNTESKRLELSNDGSTWVQLGDLTSQMVISPEYPGAILFADGSDNLGKMTSDAVESNATFKNYYEWISNKEVAQDYDILVRITLPNDFVSWKDDAIYLDYMTQNSVSVENNSVDVTLMGSSGVDAQSVDHISTLPGAWERMSLKSLDINDCNAPGDSCTLRISLTSSMEYFTRVGDITLNYNRSL